MNLAIDFSRRMSGGGLAHAKGLLNNKPPKETNIEKIYVFSSDSFLAKLPERDWIVKISHKWLNKSTIWQILWQLLLLKKAIRKNKCETVLFPSASTFVVSKRSVVMSRDMLPFMPFEVRRYPRFSMVRMRLILLKMIYSRSLKSAQVPLFLTRFAAEETMDQIGHRNHVIIPHGCNENYLDLSKNRCEWVFKKDKKIKCVYVSPIAFYKHQWNVLDAIARLREKGYDIHMTFIGGARKEAYSIFEKIKEIVDPNQLFHEVLPYVENEKLPSIILDHHIYIFASSCENMPNTLLEGMALGMPIVSSDRGPMKEVLSDGGLYFDPEDVNSLVIALEKMITDNELRMELSLLAERNSKIYTWEKTSKATYEVLASLSN